MSGEQAGLRAVVLAAGQGTRMRSALPKVMHRIVGRPLVDHVLLAAQAAGVAEAVVVVGHGREQVEAYLGATWAAGDVAIAFAHQVEQLGTADAVRCALEVLGEADGPVLILYGDVPNLQGETLGRLVAALPAGGLSLLTAVVPDPSGYGRIVRRAGAVMGIVEDRDCSATEREICEVNAGVYCVALSFLREHLRGVTSTNAAREFYLTDLVAVAAAQGGAQALVVTDAAEVAGVNDRVQLAAAARWAQQRVNARWMQAGVSMASPETTHIDVDACLAPGVALGPGVCVLGRSRLGAGVVVGANAVLEDVVLEPGEVVAPLSLRRPVV